MNVRAVYVLVISVNNDIKADVGRLGTMAFRKGTYAYVGSAQNGLGKRIARHLGKRKKRFWHIDYLLCDHSVKVAVVFWKEAKKAEECATAKRMGEVGVPVAGFGCSDCFCRSHLFMLYDRNSSGGPIALLGRTLFAAGRWHRERVDRFLGLP